MTATAETMQAKVEEMEALKARIAAMEAEIQESRDDLMARIRDLFNEEVADSLRAMGLRRVVVDVTKTGVDVALRRVGAKGKGTNGNGEKAKLYWSEFQSGKRIADIAREYGVTSGTVSALIRPFRQAADE